ncbi:MAG: MFS transporter [Acidimicrobiales bacterium]
MPSHPFVPLRHRSVRLLWGAAVISDIGTWVQLIVVGSLVAADTGSALKTGLVALATFMPQGIASPVGGLLADRFDRRKVFASALTAQAVITSVLAVVLGTGVRNPIVLTALILLASASGATGAPSYAAMQPDLVPPEELMQMVSLGVYSWNSGRVVGPIIGSLLVLAVGPAWTISFNAFSFLVMAVAVLALRQPFQPRGDGGTIRSRLATGARALRGTPGCWHALRMLALVNTMMVPFMGLIPIYVQRGYGGSTQMVGIVASAQGIGAIAGGIVISILAQRHPRSTLVVGSVSAASSMLLAYALAPNLGLVVVAIFFLGGTWSCLFISLSAVIQRDAPPDSRGRVMSLMQATFGITYGFGLLGIGVLGDLTDLHIAFSTGAVIAIVGFVAITRRAPEWRAAINGHPIPDVA